MRRLMLRELSVEKQMTVLLPIVSVSLLIFGILGVTESRRVGAVPQESQQTVPVVGEAVTVAVRFCAAEQPMTLLLRIEPQHARMLIAAAPTASDGAYTVTLDAVGVRQLLEYYGDGIPTVLTEAVTYTDESGLSASFPAGQLRLYANQAAELLTVAARRGRTDIAAALLAGALRTYLVPQRSLSEDFAALCAAADTDIRIYHFHRYAAVLTAMAQAGFSVEIVPYEEGFGG